MTAPARRQDPEPASREAEPAGPGLAPAGPAPEPPGRGPGGEGPGGDEPPLRVTTLELFFDLVFAFTLTQLATLLASGFTAADAARVLLIFGLLWWMYEGYAWLTNARTSVWPPARTQVQRSWLARAVGRRGLSAGAGYRWAAPGMRAPGPARAEHGGDWGRIEA